MARASAKRAQARTTKRALERTLANHPCGTCAACCTTREVESLGKPPGLPCTRLGLRPGAGMCSVHRERPGECVAYECAWRVGALGGPELRPDRLGILFEFEDTHATGMLLLVARETRLGALDANMPLLTNLAGLGYVLYLINTLPDGTERRRMMGPEERVRAVKAAAKRKLPIVAQ